MQVHKNNLVLLILVSLSLGIGCNSIPADASQAAGTGAFTAVPGTYETLAYPAQGESACLCPVCCRKMDACPVLDLCRCPKCCTLQKKCTRMTKVILIRHAEKSGDACNAPLLDTGIARATELAHVAGNAGITTIYASDAKRSQQTVANLSESLHLAPVIYPYCAAGPAFNITRDILTNHRGETVLVAGHTNTIPALIQSLGGDAGRCPLEDRFDNLCILTLDCENTISLLHLHYGASG